ncbi:hypothetical protein GALMADRAFT_1358594 [Galerina marginata CBS 339.88]|uniref:Uncharacterized protein n=1 Tax=Galerina marginata (strain CBS 339.88) TaxID=685588 RepID=A0A067S8U4_GALM3|nr:hypothetical protein GALMADRAFT_1358594 [Galerina marginata CBS 339.88]
MRQAWVTTAILAVVFAQAAKAVNFEQCLNNINQLTIEGKTDNHGHPVSPSSSNATAITFDLCVSQCGAGQEPFVWTVFSQQFSAWLLPWLALVSQLPFGSNDKLDNLNTMLLTLGSPTLAAYSLALTTLNGRWIASLFSDYRYPNVREAVQVLSSLQQSPLQVNTDEARLASLIVLRQNRKFWRKLLEGLNYTHTWSISAAASILWVVIAYVFTIIDYFSQSAQATINTNGGSVGSLWLWLLPVVVGWLQISPKCDSTRLVKAVDDANALSYIATSKSTPQRAGRKSEKHAFSLQFTKDNDLRKDERTTAPIHNYARSLPWVNSVMVVSGMFNNAFQRNRDHEPVTDTDWVNPNSRKRSQATAEQVENYCGSEPLPNSITSKSLPPRPTGRWGLDDNAISRMILASALALMLQWGTTGGAVVIVWFTPTVGLGCRSASYIVYGSISTLVWMMLLASSILTYYFTDTADSPTIPHSTNAVRPIRPTNYRIAGLLSIFLRRCGKFLAALNAGWIVAMGIIQFSSVFDRCYCNSSVFGLRKNAYNVITLTPDDAGSMRGAWICGFLLSGIPTLFYAGFIHLRVDPPLPTNHSNGET